MTSCRAAVCLVALLALAPGPARGENWPQWRGPNLNGSTAETGLPSSWSDTENVAWVTPMPGGSTATPVVWGDRVFVSSVDKGADKLVALCVDARDGRVLWRKTIGKSRKMRNNSASAPSPVTDGRTVWFSYGTGVMVAFDYEGNALWRRELEKDYGEIVVQYGQSASPLLHGGKLYVPVMQNKLPDAWHASDRKGPLESFLLCIDPATGRNIWRQVRPTDATGESTEGYMTPVPYEYGARSEIIIAAGEYVTGHDAETGAEVWRWQFEPHDRKVWQRVVAGPVVGDGLIYVIRPRHRPLYALRAGGRGRLSGDSVAWKVEGYTPDVAVPLLYRGRLYALHDDSKVMTCLDPATGREIWRGRLGLKGVIRASPTGADGKIHIMSERGEAVVLAAGDPAEGRDEFKVLSRMDMGERLCRSTIVVSGGRLFIRTPKRLLCVTSLR